MQPLGWVLIQSDQCPYKERAFGHVERHQQWKGKEEIACESTEKRGCLQAKEGDLRRN